VSEDSRPGRHLCVSNCQFSRRIQDWASCAVPEICPRLTRTHEGFPAHPAALAITIAKLCGPGGVRAVMAENLLLKQQLIVLRRARRRAPEPDAERPAALRILVALTPPRTHPNGRHRPPPVDAPDVSSGVGTTQVPPAVLVDVVPEEARPERAGPGTHPRHRRIQVAQSSVWLPTDCAHHRADIRNRHRHERCFPHAVETLSPAPAEPDPRGCRLSATPATASGAWTCFDASPSSCGATGCSW